MEGTEGQATDLARRARRRDPRCAAGDSRQGECAMKSARTFSPPAQFGLALFRPDSSDPEQPTAQWTLSEFFDRWLAPQFALRRTSAGTLAAYRDAIAWWRIITGDPPLASIDAVVLGRFAAGLASATYTRGPLGQPLRLSAATQANHLRTVRMVLGRAGPTFHRRQVGADLIRPIWFDISAPRCAVKGCYTTDQARAIFAAAARTSSWWRTAIALAYYTGLRQGTVLALRWSDCRVRDGRPWIEIPGERVTKTGKDARVAVHARLADVLDAHVAPAARDPAAPILPAIAGRRGLYDQHHRLQREAGVDPPLSFHAWRRTHAAELARLGLAHSLAIAQAGLQHSSASTTAAHYVDVANECRRRLPDLVADQD